MSNRDSTSCHTHCSVSHVPCSADFFRSCFQMVRDSNFAHINVIIYTAPKWKKWSGIKSGLLGGHRIEPPLPVHPPGNVALRTSIKFLEKCCGTACWLKIVVFARETVWVKDCEGATFNVISSVRLETEPPKPTSLLLEQSVHHFLMYNILVVKATRLGAVSNRKFQGALEKIHLNRKMKSSYCTEKYLSNEILRNCK
jgi:hypothetical protein